MRGRGLSIGIAVLCVVASSAVVSGASPAATEAQFDAFCLAYFNALTEPEIYNHFGDALNLVESGTWTYASEKSACVAFETSVPAKSYVQYGPRPDYYLHVTTITSRNTFLHVHTLKNLVPYATTYYRIIAVDQKGRVIRTNEMTVTARQAPSVVHVPEQLSGPPYVLDKANTTYLVTRDLVCPSTAFNIVADGVTLDLGGNTVTYNEVGGAPDPGASKTLYGPFASTNPCGIRGAAGKKGIRIVNGTIKQGVANGTSKPGGYEPIYLYKPGAPEIAGVKVIFAGGQVNGIIVRDAAAGAHVHHNIINDLGTELYNRHIAVDAIAFDIASAGAAPAKCDHNLVLRTRHRGIKASPKCEIVSNEIYIDSYATNSYGIMYYARSASGLTISNNKVFGTGFHPIGIGSGQGWSNVKVTGNYVQMQGTPQTWRWRGGEGGGDRDARMKRGVFPVNGIRLQKPVKDVEHIDNVVVVKGYGQTCWMRGLWLMPHQGVGTNVVFRGNRIKLAAMDPYANGYAVGASGSGTQAAKPTVLLDGNRIESNVTNVQLADNNGGGGPYIFTHNTLVRLGADARYRTIRMGWPGSKQETYSHEFIDNHLEGGAAYNLVSFDGVTGRRLEFQVMWNVEIRTAGGATVTIRNSENSQVRRGTADGNGTFRVSLTETVYRAAGNKVKSPYVIEVQKGRKKATKQVTVDRSQTVSIDL